MVGSDSRMDQKGNADAPVNGLPLKCSRCRFVDLDFVPQPYFLAKGIDSPTDMARAEAGNFLVRERIRQLVELVAPGQCEFFPTQALKTKEPTQWFLAVPKAALATGVVKQSIKRCPECDEPLSAHGTQFETRFLVESSVFDIFKSHQWISIGEKAPDYAYEYFRKCVDHRHALALTRELYFSVRFETLLKRIGVRGLCRWVPFTEKPSVSDLNWVEELGDC